MIDFDEMIRFRIYRNVGSQESPRWIWMESWRDVIAWNADGEVSATFLPDHVYKDCQGISVFQTYDLIRVMDLMFTDMRTKEPDGIRKSMIIDSISFGHASLMEAKYTQAEYTEQRRKALTQSPETV